MWLLNQNELRRQEIKLVRTMAKVGGNKLSPKPQALSKKERTDTPGQLLQLPKLPFLLSFRFFSVFQMSDLWIGEV